MNRKVVITISVLFLCVLGIASAQSARDRAKKQFEAYKQQQMQAFQEQKQEQKQEFYDFRQRQKEMFKAYADQMRKEWEEYKAEARMIKAVKPKPEAQPLRPENANTEDLLLPVAEVQNSVCALNRKAGGSLDDDIPDDFLDDLVDYLEEGDDPEPEPEPLPKTDFAGNSSAGFSFQYRQTECKVRMGDDFKVSLTANDEESCATAWEKLGEAEVANLLDDCQALQKAMHLSDWGFFDLVRTLGDAYYGEGKDISTLFQFMMLVSANYQAKLCRVGEKLAVMVSFDGPIYGYSYVTLNSQKYYVLTKEEFSSCRVVNVSQDGAKDVTLFHSSIPVFAYASAPTRIMKFPGIDKEETLSVKLRPNKNLMNYYSSYPLNDHWDFYVNTALSRELKKALYPVLRKQISGKSELEAVNFLLTFIQKGMDYKTDDEQFGYERPMFGDETFFYPYCDCEDRAILLSVLVSDLLNLDVVLLEYDDHVTTAIRFNQQDGLKGSYFELDDGRYYCCDPTYIGAGVGESMPDYAGKGAKIIRL